MGIKVWKTTVSTFRWEGAGFTSSPEHVSFVEPMPGRASESSPGNIYIMAESTDESSFHEKRIMKKIKEEFYSSSIQDVESALEKTMELAEESAENMGKQFHVSVVVISGNHAYIAQAGAALVGVCLGEEIAWYSPLAEGKFAPLGKPGGEPVIFHLTLTASDRIHILSTDWINLIDHIGDDVVEKALCQPGSVKSVAERVRIILPPDTPPLEVLSVSVAAPAASRAAPVEKKQGRKFSLRLPSIPLFVKERRGGTTKVSSTSGRGVKPRVKKEARKGKRRGISVYWWLILIPLVLALVSGGYWLHRRNVREAEYRSLVSQSKVLLSEATQSGVPPQEARKKLQIAWDDTQKALELHPGAKEVLKLQEQIQEAENVLNHVVKLYLPLKLRTFTGAHVSLSRVVVSGNDIFVLDKGDSAVYHDKLNPTSDDLVSGGPTKPVLKKGDMVGTTVVGDLIDMTWMPAVGPWQTAGVLVMDSSNHVFRIPVAGIQTVSQVSVGGGAWKLPTLIRHYMGNIYVLDPKSNQVWKHVLKHGAYDPPEGYFAQGGVDLSGVVDMAIDGYIYLLTSDGRVLKFLAGNPQPFELSTLDTPLRTPRSFFTDTNTKNLYIADTGNNRIVEVSKEGKLRRQFSLAEHPLLLGKVKSIAVLETAGEFYLVTDKDLYLVNFPRE